jgi:CheY-like chemotaxis protein
MRIAAEVLHELRQPLLGVKAYAQLLGEEVGTRPPLRLMLAQVERMEQIISDFTRLSSDRPAPQQRVTLGTHVQAALKLFALNPDSARLTVDVEGPEDLALQGNGRLLEQLVINLLNNAREAVVGQGRIKVVMRNEGGSPALYVADWGAGVPETLRERIFEPYVTASKRGTGLGLAVCKRIAQEHRARVELVPPSTLAEQPPPATVFRVLFPALESVPAPTPVATPAPTPAPTPTAQRRRLLVVDDEEIIRGVFRDLMGRECEVLEACNAEEALEHLQRGPVDLIVTDKNLPGLSGLELAQQARKMDPASRVILMTGYPSLVTAQQAMDLGLLDYLLKPFDDIREVRTKLREALSGALPERKAPPANSRRVDIFEDNPAVARQLSEALTSMGLEARVYATANEPSEPEAPAAVVVSWDFGPAHGRKALELARKRCQGAPLVVVAESLSQDTVLEALRAGALACLLRHQDSKEFGRKLSRLLKAA